MMIILMTLMNTLKQTQFNHLPLGRRLWHAVAKGGYTYDQKYRQKTKNAKFDFCFLFCVHDKGRSKKPIRPT